MVKRKRRRLQRIIKCWYDITERRRTVLSQTLPWSIRVSTGLRPPTCVYGSLKENRHLRDYTSDCRPVVLVHEVKTTGFRSAILVKICAYRLSFLLGPLHNHLLCVSLSFNFFFFRQTRDRPTLCSFLPFFPRLASIKSVKRGVYLLR